MRDNFLRALSSSSESSDESQPQKPNEWQYIGRIKHKKFLTTPKELQPSLPETSNRYSALMDDASSPDIHECTKPKHTPKPPPMYVHGVLNYAKMNKSITEVEEEEHFCTKTLTNNVIKMSCTTPDTFRTIVKHFKEKNIYFHTYQLKEDRAFRVVLKHLHHTTDTNDIKRELAALGHTFRNITKIRHGQIKNPLNQFYVDIEPAQNNKDIYAITAIQNKIILFEPPRTNMTIPQCTRCQQYGHTQRYCNKPLACVKCSGYHHTSVCTKSRDTPAKFVPCGGPHPANYKVCPQYRSILQGFNPRSLGYTPRIVTHSQQPPQPPSQLPPFPPTQHQSRSYANVASSPPQLAEEYSPSLHAFLEDFKTLMTHLLYQNGMIISMHTKLINTHV